MLNLRTVDPASASRKTAADAAPSTPEVDTVRFAHGTLLGNIGAPLRTEGFGDEEYEEYEEGGGVEMQSFEEGAEVGEKEVSGEGGGEGDPEGVAYLAV